jgi:thioredoxin 1
MIKNLSEKDFESAVLKSKGITLVDFWANWCGPCKMMAPVLESISDELKEVSFAKVNVDENENLADKYEILSIPTLLVFKDGKPVDTLVGFMPKDSLKQAISKHL